MNTFPAALATVPGQIFSKNVNPSSKTVAANSSAVLDVGGVACYWSADPGGGFFALGTKPITLPATVNSLRAGVRIHLSDGTTADYVNTAGSAFVMSDQNLLDLAAGSNSSSAINDGLNIVGLSLLGNNPTGSPITGDLSTFYLRLYVAPVGQAGAIA